jgi:hypothetical protein
MSETYEYTISSQTNDGFVNSSLLRVEIIQSITSPALTHINTEDGKLKISFVSELSSGQESDLTTIVNDHSGTVSVNTLGTYAEAESEVSTTSTSYVNRLTLSVVSIEEEEVILSWCAELGQTSNDRPARCRVVVNGTTIAEYWETMRIRSTTTEFRPVSGFQKITLAVPINTITVDYASTSDGGTAKLRRVRLHIGKVG